MIGRPSGRGLLLGGVVVGVLIVVGAAIWVLDSPAEERRRQLDRQRVEDLRAISNAVDAYWTREDVLPADLEALTDWQNLDVRPSDPVTGAPYRYQVTGERSYRLCATFATTDPGGKPRRSWQRYPIYWNHPPGDHCFERQAEDVQR